MIRPDLDSLRLFLHVLAASIWVGGQIVLGALVSRLRASNPQSLQTVANAFGRVAWPAFAVALVTGMWNLWSVNPTEHGHTYLVTLAVKLGLVGVAAASTIVHSHSRTRLGLALGGAIGLVSSLAVMWLGVVIAHAG
jgi:putative copper export protein